MTARTLMFLFKPNASAKNYLCEYKIITKTVFREKLVQTVFPLNPVLELYFV